MRWTSSPRFGLVRQSTLLGDAEDVELLDGLINLMPAGVQVARPSDEEALRASVLGESTMDESDVHCCPCISAGKKLYIIPSDLGLFPSQPALPRVFSCS